MLKNHLKIAWRNIIRNRTYALVNITGLSLGIGMAIVIFCIVRFESSFDTFHAKSDRLYKIISHDAFNELDTHIPQGIIKALKEDIPGVEKVATVYRFDPSVIRVGQQNFKQKNAFFIQPSFFDMIDVEWVQGSPQTSLSQPYQVVLDEPTAQRLFNGDAMGKTIRYDNQLDLIVSGIVKKSPANSDFQLQMVLSYATLAMYMEWLANEDYWSGGDSQFQGYVLLKPDTDIKAIEAGLAELIKPYTANDRSNYTAFTLKPFSAIHFDTETWENFNYSTPKWLLYVLGSAGIFLILIGCINFINIAIVQAMERNKDTGVRKILGGSKRQIVSGFLVETGVIVALSLLIAVLLARVLLPFADRLLSTHVAQADNWEGITWLFIFGTAIVCTLLSGIYPAIVLSRFRPVALLRDRMLVSNGSGLSLRRSLVISQFVIAQLLVTCTLIGIRQVGYLYEKDLGFNQSSIVTVDMPESEGLLRERFRKNLMKYPAIEEVTYGLTTPASIGNWWWAPVKYSELENGEQQFRRQFVDTNYFSFFRIPLVAGRSFTSADTAQVVAMINEKAAHDMGFKDAGEAIGSRVKMFEDTFEITGVVKDYNSQSLRESIKPHIFLQNGRYFLAAIRIEPSQRSAALAHIEQEWKTIFPDNFFEYGFLDDDLQTFYESESKFAGILSLFSVVSLIISCLGIYGLVSFICRIKTKEIGIRKVLGASVAVIVSLLSKDFVKLVLIAVVVASPLAWWMMNKWLEGFAYRIDIQWWMFPLVGLAAVGLTVLAVSGKAIRAALANPIDSLRDE